MKEKTTEELYKLFEQANKELDKLKLYTHEYSKMIDKEYESCNLFFIKDFLNMLISEENQDCVDTQVKKLRQLWGNAFKAFEEYVKTE